MTSKLDTLLKCLPASPFKEQLEAEITALIEDRARFPDRPDDIGKMIGSRINNTKTALKNAEDTISRLRIEIGANAHAASIGRAILRACGELPEGWDLHIECEYGAATVRLYLPDTDSYLTDFGSDITLAQEIDNAINIAQAEHEKATQ